MLRTGHSTTSGIRHYKRVGEKMKMLTSDVLNGAKRPKSEVITPPEDAQDVQEDKEFETKDMPKLDDNSKFSTLLDAGGKKTVSTAPLSFSGASHFTIYLNF